MSEVEAAWRVIREGEGPIHRLEVHVPGSTGVFVVVRWDDSNTPVRKVVYAVAEVLPKRVKDAFMEIDIQAELNDMDGDLLAMFPAEEIDTMHQPIEDEDEGE